MKTLKITHNGADYTRTTGRDYTHVAVFEATGRTPLATWHLSEKAALRSMRFQAVKVNSAGDTLYRKGQPITVSIGTRTVIAL